MVFHSRPDRSNRPHHLSLAFTLIELLVVVSIIIILIAILVPAMERAMMAAQQAKCAAHMKGWGSAAAQYGVSNKQDYPYNQSDDGGNDISWVSKTMLRFFAEYMEAYELTDENQILDCPTQRYHPTVRKEAMPGRSGWRGGTYSVPSAEDPTTGDTINTGWSVTVDRSDFEEGKQWHWSELTTGLIGYFILPHRNPNVGAARALGTFPDGENWMARPKRGNGPDQAPIMADMKQSQSPNGNYNEADDNWYMRPGIPFSSHAGSGGVPRGGNFLYEGGHVVWEPNDRIHLGWAAGSWRVWYRPLGTTPANAP